MNSVFSVRFMHESGWGIVTDVADLNRWRARDVMPRMSRIMEHASKQTPGDSIAASNEIHLKMEGKPDCVLIFIRYPRGRLTQEAGIRGHVWMGLAEETAEFWRNYKADGHTKRFTLTLPNDPGMN